MLTERDISTLKEAGIKMEDLASEAADFLRRHPLRRLKPVANGFSAEEERFLLEGGAGGVGEPTIPPLKTDLTTIASEYTLLVLTSYTQKAVAELLGVSTSRVRQRIDSGSLYAIEGSAGRVCPAFQFSETGTLPGLDAVLNDLSQNAHPVAVQRFFLSPSLDLESNEIEGALSPRDWLLSGHSTEPVKLQIREL